MRVLVTDGDTRAALAVTRSLGRAGHTVFVTAPRRHSLAGTSRYASMESRQASVSDGPDELKRTLVSRYRDLAPAAILGVTDRTLTALHELKQESGEMVLPPPTGVDYFEASDKVRLFEACRDLGIIVPDGLVVPGGELPGEAELRSLGTPFVVRPGLSWRVGAGRWIAGKVSIENDHAGLAARQQRDPSLGFPYLVQRKISGQGCGLFVLADRGRIGSVFAHRRLREKPPWGGVSTLCESVEPSADLVEAVERYISERRWSGLAMFEFKRSTQTGEPHLLEINARPWGSMQLASASGVDFAGSLMALARHSTVSDRKPYRTGVRLRWWWGDVDHFYLRETAGGRSGVKAMLAGLIQAARRGPWRANWDTLQNDDPIPFGFETVQWLRR